MRRARLAAVVAAATWALFGSVGAAIAQPGQWVKDVLLPLPTGGESVAFDGHFLYYTTPGDPPIHRVDPVTNVPGDDLNTLVSMRVLAYDATRDMFWGIKEDVIERQVFLIDKNGAEVWQLQIRLEQMDDPLQPRGPCGTGFCNPQISGIAYDSNPDSLWIAPDGTHRIYHFGTDGTLLGYYDIDHPGESEAEPCGPPQQTGLAVATHSSTANGGHTSIMYNMAGECPTRTWFKYQGDDDDTPHKLAAYSTYNGTVMEDGECDDESFGVNVVWIRDATDGMVHAFEAPNCIMGGGTKILDKSRMTGGGGLPVLDPIGGGEAHHGFMIHCDPTVQPDRLQISWGNGNIFHLTHLTDVKCTAGGTTPLTGQPFDTMKGSGTGRLNGQRDCGRVEFEFKDNGEPGKGLTADTGDLTVYNLCSPTPTTPVMHATGVLLVGNLAGEGNYQAHQGA